MSLDFYYTAIKNVSQSTKFNLHSDNIIEWYDTEQTQPTDSEIQAEIIRLQAVYDSQEYARLRKAEYDQLNQFEMQFDDNRDGTTTWVDAVNSIKARYPK
jgi:hypothetical protein